MKIELSSDTAPLKVGDEFLKYEIRALLGHGDHAYVYEAFDPMLDRMVAIKLIPDPPNSRRDLVQRSLEQAPILRDLNHPNLVAVHDVGTIGDELVYIVMERLIGRTLRSLLVEQHTLSLAEVLSIGIQVAEGMAWAHVQQVIHRDLKPENVFMTDGTPSQPVASKPPKQGVKVINAGITSFIVPSGMTTEWDCVRGTLLYMSPEHVQGYGVTARSDIFALGTTLYECLAGSPPSLVNAGQLTLDEVTWRQISFTPPPLNELLSDIPEAFADLIQQMIAKEAVLRFGTMDEVSVRLQEILRQLPSEAANGADGAQAERPYIVFPSSALGIKAAANPEQAPSPGEVVAGAERLVSALTAAQSPKPSPQPTPNGLAPRAGNRYRYLAGMAITLGVLAGILIALLKSHLTTASSSSLVKGDPANEAAPSPRAVGQSASGIGSAIASPSKRPTAADVSLGEAKTPKKSDGYATGGTDRLGFSAPGDAPVINPGKTGSREPKAKPSSSSDLVF